MKPLIKIPEIKESMLVHMSRGPIELMVKRYPQKECSKPRGFWYSVGREWVDWCSSEMPHWVGEYFYEVDVSGCKMLRIKSLEDLYKFDEDYAFKTDDGPRNGWLFGWAIDWKRVKGDGYDGIEISPYQHQARFDVMWYYSWDIASGCVWNLDNVELREI